MDAMITTAIKAPIMAYSIAVDAFVSCKNLVKSSIPIPKPVIAYIQWKFG